MFASIIIVTHQKLLKKYFVFLNIMIYRNRNGALFNFTIVQLITHVCQDRIIILRQGIGGGSDQLHVVTSGEHKSQHSKCDQLLAAVVFVSRFGMVGPYNYRNRPMCNQLYYYCDLKL